jgi:nitroimidazol reductase NimA-like FMN-containing flavoprotein (pyridoxamine 5'-phosphate oxidase superfamily)
MEDIKEEIVQYLSKRRFITLATTTKKGEPLTHPVAYINKGPIIYFSTIKQSRKVKNIVKNPNVAYSLFDTVEHLDELRTLQMVGIAKIVTNKNESEEALKLLKQKFPLMADMPIDSDNIIVKINPKTCYFSDYTKRFGYRDKVDF